MFRGVICRSNHFTTTSGGRLRRGILRSHAASCSHMCGYLFFFYLAFKKRERGINKKKKEEEKTVPFVEMGLSISLLQEGQRERKERKEKQERKAKKSFDFWSSSDGVEKNNCRAQKKRKK